MDFLRCVKYWHSQRQIPGTKEGGYPILAWILFALQRLQAFISREERFPDHALRLLAALDFFFQPLSSSEAADGNICTPGGAFCPQLWQFPCILDPVAMDVGSRSLAPEIPEAMQLLYAQEFLRARTLVGEAVRGKGAVFSQLFEPSLSSSLPVTPASTGAFVLKGHKLWLVEVQSIRKLRDSWTAPFLHRCDAQTELLGCLLSVDSTGALQRFPELRQRLAFSPCNFVASARLDSVPRAPGLAASPAPRLQQGDLQRWQDLQKLLPLVP